LTMEAIPDARKAYLDALRKDAYVKVAESYRPMMGSQFDDPTVPSSVSTAQNTEKNSSKKDKKEKKDKNH
jgi:hypothetical protein